MNKNSNAGLNYDYTEFISKAFMPGFTKGYIPVKCYSEENLYLFLDYLEGCGFKWLSGCKPTDHIPEDECFGDDYIVGFKQDGSTIGLYDGVEPYFTLTFDEFMQYEGMGFKESFKLDSFLDDVNIKG